MSHEKRSTLYFASFRNFRRDSLIRVRGSSRLVSRFQILKYLAQRTLNGMHDINPEYN